MPKEAGELTNPAGREKTTPRLRFLLILFEAALVLGLLLVWLTSEGVRTSTNLVILFLYSFPSEFLVGLAAHEPVLIFYGAHHPAWVVALVAVVSTVMAEGLNYSFFGLFFEIPAFRAALTGPGVSRITEMFSRMPFKAILVAGFTPVPFFPVRFLVVMTDYPIWKYLLGVFLSRAPRFYLLALLGGAFHIPGIVLIGIFVAMFVLVNLPAVLKVLASQENPAEAGGGSGSGSGSGLKVGERPIGR